MKLDDYLLRHDPLLVLSQSGCSTEMLELAKVGLSSRRRFPKFQMSIGYGFSPSASHCKHIYTWFLDPKGRPKHVIRQSRTGSQYYLGLWFCRSLIDPSDQYLCQAKTMPGVSLRGEWIWLSDKSSDLNKGVMNAFFGNR